MKSLLGVFFLLITFFNTAWSKDWSILICTLKEREEVFQNLYNKLQNQIHKYKLEDKVEVLYFLDDREHTVGFKRNALMDQAQGEYVNFLDDDDDVHNKYIKMIYRKLKHKPDCVSLVGIITFDGKNPRSFIHSIQYDSYFEKDNIYYRPPNHLNTIKRSIASQFRFPEINYGEDSDWAMQVLRSGLIQNEAKIDVPYYFYKYVSK